MNVIARAKIEIAYFKVAVQHFSHHATKITPQIPLNSASTTEKLA